MQWRSGAVVVVLAGGSMSPSSTVTTVQGGTPAWIEAPALERMIQGVPLKDAMKATGKS